MRIIRYVISALLIASNVGIAGTGPLSLKVSALDPTVKGGSKIMIQVTTTNASNSEITYHNTNRCDYSVKVLTSAAAPVPETPFKKQMACGGGGELRITGRDIVVTLKPGESNDERIELTELYNISAPGQYSVQVDRTFPQIGHFGSNVVSIKVTQ
jgi:hypothetical protein